MRIAEILSKKDIEHVITINPGATVRELVARLAEYNVGALVVSSDGEHVDGIVSERDVVRNLASNTRVLDAEVRDIMTSVVHQAGTSDRLDDVMASMTELRIRHVPVVTETVLVGIVSIGDLVKHKISALEFERDQLDSYVHQS